jgi:hypothetical protein
VDNDKFFHPWQMTNSFICDRFFCIKLFIYYCIYVFVFWGQCVDMTTIRRHSICWRKKFSCYYGYKLFFCYKIQITRA